MATGKQARAREHFKAMVKDKNTKVGKEAAKKGKACK